MIGYKYIEQVISATSQLVIILNLAWGSDLKCFSNTAHSKQ